MIVPIIKRNIIEFFFTSKLHQDGPPNSVGEGVTQWRKEVGRSYQPSGTAEAVNHCTDASGTLRCLVCPYASLISLHMVPNPSKFVNQYVFLDVLFSYSFQYIVYLCPDADEKPVFFLYIHLTMCQLNFLERLS